MTTDRFNADHGMKRADFISALFHAFFVCMLLLAVTFTSGCSSSFLDDREGYANTLASGRGWVAKNIQTQAFTLRTYGPKAMPQQQVDTLTVYVEGDGLAWKTRNTPAMDPTPDNPVALELALSQGSGAVAYLARPCQYTISLDRNVCNYTHWTVSRYSDQIVRSMDEGLSALKTMYGAKRIRLVGYSGGGVIAALLASRRTDIVQLVSVAANLDTDYWTRLHGVTPLYDSLNPAKYKSLAAISQIHFVGEKDKISPISVARSYLRSIGVQGEGAIHRVPGMTHECCWADVWPSLFATLQVNS